MTTTVLLASHSLMLPSGAKIHKSADFCVSLVTTWSNELVAASKNRRHNKLLRVCDLTLTLATVLQGELE